MIRAGGDQRIQRPADVWVRPTNPFEQVNHSSLRNTPELLGRLQRFANALEQTPPPVGSRASAVLVPIFDGPSGPEVVLTRRSQVLTSHKGEVSFPGGRVDAGETFIQAAIREAYEEINLEPSHVQVIGEMNALSTYVSNSHIVPVLAYLETPPSMTAVNAEVDRVFSVALTELVRDDTYVEEHWGTPPNQHQIHFFHLDDETVWGATGKMLHQLINIAVLSEWA
jgi:8-oxo-dGTP pyrophosphatase MutT (NUDIX family)